MLLQLDRKTNLVKVVVRLDAVFEGLVVLLLDEQVVEGVVDLGGT